MQSKLSNKDYENYVSISGQIKFPKKMGDALPSPNSDNNKIEDPDDNNELSFHHGSNPFMHEEDTDDDYFTDLLNKYQNLLYMNYKNIKNYDIENPINGIRTLILRRAGY